jgi:hypothetical protein
MLLHRLYPGDDVSYRSSPSLPQSSGRIIAVDASTFTVQRYSRREDFPAPPLMCLHIDEVCITNETEVIPRATVDGIMFILTVEEIHSHPISLLGVSNIRFLRFSTDQSTILNPISQWESFRRNGAISYPHMIWITISHIGIQITRKLNKGSMSQNPRQSFKIFCPVDVFEYIKNQLVDHCRYIERSGHRTNRVIYYNLSKQSIRSKVSIQELVLDTDESISLFKHLFGLLAGTGSRARHPRANEPADSLHIFTEVNRLDYIKFLYIGSIRELSVSIQYASHIINNNFHLD